MSISRHRRISFLSLVLGLLCLFSRSVSAAWQEIAAYTDCGSTNFKTQKILVNFDMDTYWLNISVLGQFTTDIVESDLNTLRYSMLPSLFPFTEVLTPSYSDYRCLISPEPNIYQFVRLLSESTTLVA